MKNFSIKRVRAAKMKKQTPGLVSYPLDWIDTLPQKGLNLITFIFPFPNKEKDSLPFGSLQVLSLVKPLKHNMGIMN